MCFPFSTKTLPLRSKIPDVAKLADALDLGSSGVIHVGSTPIIRTKTNKIPLRNRRGNFLKYN